jgi:hypothetical protein
MLVKRTGTIFVVLLFSSLLPAENQEKAQKKVLEAHAKAIIAEAKTLEKSGQLVEARVKYAESQAMLETRDALDAIKHRASRGRSSSSISILNRRKAP